MSHPSDDWGEPDPSYRSRLTSALGDRSRLHSNQQSFSVNAPTFRPMSLVSATLAQDTFDKPPPSPFYPLQTSTFMPPDTPEISCPSTPPAATHGAQVTARSEPRTHYSALTNQSPAKVGGLFHGLDSIWATGNNQLNFAHNRENSSTVYHDYKDAAERTGIQRPRSRSDAPRVTSGPRYSCYTAPNSYTPPKKSSAVSSPGYTSAIAEPSPRRQLLRSQGVSEHEWHKSPVQLSKQAPYNAKMNESTITDKFQHMAISTAGAIDSRFALAGYGHPQNMVSQDMTGRETPGGVFLPAEFKSPDGGSSTPRNLPRTFGSASAHAGAQEFRRVSSNGNGFGNSPGQLRTKEYGVESRGTSITSLDQDPTKAATAKYLADLIKSGGLEPADQGARVPSMPMRRGPAPRPVPQNHQPWPPSELALQQTMGPDPLVRQWKAKGGATWTDVSTNLAFVERARAAKPTNYGVIKLTDIPYSTTKPEVVALLGEKAPMVQMPSGSGTYAIHIIMERGTAKSMDAYVEFITQEAAQQCCARIEAHGRPMIQARRVTVALSSQETLMKDLFPRAKSVRWEGSQPVILENKDMWSSGFQGFVSSEELVMTVKVAQNPQRSRFAVKHQQRTYESMISLMFKYPWNAVDFYTLAERDLIFKAVRDQLVTLSEKLRRDGSNPPIDPPLLYELLDAGLKCPGFSERQRAELIDASEGCMQTGIYVTPMAHYWPFEILGRRDSLSEELVQYFTSLLRASSAPAATSLAQLSAMNGRGAPANVNPHFGDFQITYPQSKSQMTVAAAASVEWNTVEIALRKMVKDDTK